MIENKPIQKSNRLAGEKSPYLLQHAHNPVDWYPWGEEAFNEARRRDCPVLLSIGYSTCHWCHVMEKESFENTAVAKVMNRHFVSIKVDREERPDIDAVYMNAVNALTGSGGWPLNVFLTPARKPFFGGTYFPPAPRHGNISWLDLLIRIAELWQAADQRHRIDASAERLTAALSPVAATPAHSIPAPAQLAAEAVVQLNQSFDGVWGGFGRATKFPMAPLIDFLLARRPEPITAPDAEGRTAREMGLATLDAIADGAIRDHIGGGFHRYATDPQWRLPHFEKMLYDNAQLAVTFSQAYTQTADPTYRDVAEETIVYVLRDLGHRDGGFYSAEDADSPAADTSETGGVEGAFYVWTHREIAQLLTANEAAVFNARYGVLAGGNVAMDPHGEFTGKNILSIAETIEAVARRFGITVPEATARIATARQKLFLARCRRPRPHRDDKIITEWNALMIAALSRAAVQLGMPDWLREASRSAAFLHRHLYVPETRLLYRRWRDDERQVLAMAADHAHLINALLDLFSAGSDPRWLVWSIELAESLLNRFFDSAIGGFRMADIHQSGELIVNCVETIDGVTPSTNAAAVSALMRLGRLLHESRFTEAATVVLNAQAAQIARYPASAPGMVGLLETAASQTVTVFVAGDIMAPDTIEMSETARKCVGPASDIVMVTAPGVRDLLCRHLPAVEHMIPVDGRATAYVCIGTNCMAPENRPERLARLLTRKPLNS